MEVRALSDKFRYPLVGLAIVAAAMTYVEAAGVIYLRWLRYYPHDPLALFTLQPLRGTQRVVKWGRAISILVMLLGVARLTEKTGVRTFSGLWDIFRMTGPGCYSGGLQRNHDTGMINGTYRQTSRNVAQNSEY